MKICVQIEGPDEISRTLQFEVAEDCTIHTAAHYIAKELEIEVEDVLDDLTWNGELLRKDGVVCHHPTHTHPWKHCRVCIELHFETKQARHHFGVTQKWKAVHRWGCRHFHIAHEACPNLELREGTITGPPLNERVVIGNFKECKTIWLVKPGPEQNG